MNLQKNGVNTANYTEEQAQNFRRQVNELFRTYGLLSLKMMSATLRSYEQTDKAILDLALYSETRVCLFI